MGVLSAVLPHAGGVALDITGVLVPLAVKGRVKEADHPGLPVKEPVQCGGDGLIPPFPVRSAGEQGEGLGDGVDLALAALRRAQGGTVLVVAPAVPAAIPGALGRLDQGVGLAQQVIGPGLLVHPAAQDGEILQHRRQKPGEPLRLTLHLVHAVVPVAAPHSGQTAGARPPAQGAEDSGQAVAVEVFPFFAHLGDLIAVLLPRLQGLGGQIGDLLLQNGPVPGDSAVPAQHPGQPQQIVRDAGAHPGPLGRVPPVLHIPLLKLPGGTQQQLLPGPLRPGVHQGS